MFTLAKDAARNARARNEKLTSERAEYARQRAARVHKAHKTLAGATRYEACNGDFKLFVWLQDGQEIASGSSHPSGDEVTIGDHVFHYYAATRLQKCGTSTTDRYVDSTGQVYN